MNTVLESLENNLANFERQIKERQQELQALKSLASEARLGILSLRGWKIGAVVYSERLEQRAVIHSFRNDFVPSNPKEIPKVNLQLFNKDGKLGKRIGLSCYTRDWKLTGEIYES